MTCGPARVLPETAASPSLAVSSSALSSRNYFTSDSQDGCCSSARVPAAQASCFTPTPPEECYARTAFEWQRSRIPAGFSIDLHEPVALLPRTPSLASATRCGAARLRVRACESTRRNLGSATSAISCIRIFVRHFSYSSTFSIRRSWRRKGCARRERGSSGMRCTTPDRRSEPV